MSEAKRSATAKLTITVKPVDSNPPIITASSIEGFVDENAPIGTKVIDKDGDPIVLTVSDADLVSSISFDFLNVFFPFGYKTRVLSFLETNQIVDVYIFIDIDFSIIIARTLKKRSFKDIIDRSKSDCR